MDTHAVKTNAIVASAASQASAIEVSSSSAASQTFRQLLSSAHTRFDTDVTGLLEAGRFDRPREDVSAGSSKDRSDPRSEREQSPEPKDYNRRDKDRSITDKDRRDDSNMSRHENGDHDRQERTEERSSPDEVRPGKQRKVSEPDGRNGDREQPLHEKSTSDDSKTIDPDINASNPKQSTAPDGQQTDSIANGLGANPYMVLSQAENQNERQAATTNNQGLSAPSVDKNTAPADLGSRPGFGANNADTAKTAPNQLAQGNNQGQANPNQAQPLAADELPKEGEFANSAKIASDSGVSKDASKSRQRADLANRVGDNVDLSLKVSVTDKAQTLISKPTQALAGNTQTAETQNQTLRAQQAPQGAAIAGLNPAAQQAQGQNGQAATQSLATGQNASLSSTQALGGEAKSGIQLGATQSTHSTLLTSSGGEASLSAAGKPGAPVTPQSLQNPTTNQATQQTLHMQTKHEITSQVEVQINKAIKLGADSITIKLRPADMGRVEVQMEMSQDGRISAVVTADNQRSLELLREDSRSLQRALEDAGFQTDENSLEFNLKEHAGDGRLADKRGATNGHENQETPLDDNSEQDLGLITPEPLETISKDRIDITA